MAFLPSLRQADPREEGEVKTAIYIEQGREQIVLTPENDLEKSVLDKIIHRTPAVSFFQGSFYNCQGGWIRHGYHFEDTPHNKEEVSLIILLDEKK